MSQGRPSLTELLDIDITISVVDVGANPHDGNGPPPYDALLKRGNVRLVGFEPNREMLAVLEAQKGPNEIYLPHAVYDGSIQTLRLCKASGMTSLLEPNMAVLGAFHGFDQWGEVIAREQIETVRLDDVAEVSDLDFLKIDIQGGELEVFRNGTQKLSDCLVIQSEVEFLEMYEGQPLFTDVDLFLREHGFVLHQFVEPVSRIIKPLAVNNDPYAGLNQLMWADAVFVRDFTRFGELAPEKLLKLALILHDVFNSFDLALRALLMRDAKVGERLGQAYLQKLQIA